MLSFDPQLPSIESATLKQEAESRELYTLFQSRYLEISRVAQALIRRHGISHIDIDPAELVSDCFVELGQGRRTSHFLMSGDPQRLINVACDVMTSLLSHRIREGLANEHKQVEIEDVQFYGWEPSARIVALDDALTQLATEYPHLSRVVEYRYFGGLSNKEMAALFGVSSHAIAQDWAKARLWLAEALGVTKHEAVEAQHSTTESSIRLITFTKELYAWLVQNPDRLRSLTDDDFERLVADRLGAMGLGVQRVGNVNKKDGGVDIVAWPERSSSFPFLLAAQVKHHRTSRNSGPADVRDFLGVLTSQGSHFHLGLIVTNTSFSADAQWFANNNSKLLRLRDLNDLCRWMRDDFINEFEWREIPNHIELAPGVTIEIPKKRLWTP